MQLDVICLETEAYYKLLAEVIDLVKSQNQKEEEWIDGDKAMSILKVGTTTLQMYRDQNKIRVSRLSKKHLMYYKPSLIEFLENNVQSY
jgi:hypothetical protein